MKTPEKHPSEAPIQASGVFLSMFERTLVKDEIERLRKLKNPNKAQQQRLNQIEQISRRDMLRKLGLLAGASTAVISGTVWHHMFGEPKETQTTPSTPESEAPLQPAEAQPTVLEIPERMTGPQAIQTLTMNYNKWMRSASQEDLQNNGTSMFVDLYTKVRANTIGIDLPELTVADFNSNNFTQKLSKVTKAFNTIGYHVYILPTLLDGEAVKILYIAIVSGKKIHESTVVPEHGDKKDEFKHIIIDIEDPAHSNDRYFTEATEISAMTYKDGDSEKYTVLQARWAYKHTAEARYKKLMGSGTSESELANRIVLQQYNDIPQAEAIVEITRRVMKNSLDHEKQHVLDKVSSSEKQIAMGPEYATVRRLFDEIRGLLAAVATDDPKIGLLNVFMWKNGSGMNGKIGKAIEDIFFQATGKTLLQLLSLPDERLYKLGMNMLRATDNLFAVGEIIRFNPEDPRFIEADQKMIQEFEKIKASF